MMFSVFTMQKMIDDAIKYNEEILQCIDEGSHFDQHYTLQLIFKAAQTSLDCLKVYQKINDDQIKECEAMTHGKVI